MENVIALTDDSFDQEVLQSKDPVLVDFWAPWCAPCRMIAPMIDELAGENRGSIKVAKLDVAEYSENAQKYGISNIPTLLIFKDGQIVSQFVGAPSKQKLQQAIDAAKA